MPYPPSIRKFSGFDKAKKVFGARKNEKTPYLKEVTSGSVFTPKPPPRKDEPSQREVKPADAKAETTGAIIAQETEDRAQEEEARTQTANAVVQVTQTRPRPEIDSTNVRTHQDAFEREIELRVTGSYAKMLAHEQTSGFDRYTTSVYSYYTPNCISLMTTLHEMERAMDSNMHLEWSQKKFLSLPCRIYYCSMYYIWLLYVRDMAKDLDQSTSTWLRKFLRDYPLESLPLAGPLEPFFGNLCAYDPKSSKLSLLVPQLPADVGNKIKGQTGPQNIWNMTQPNTAALFDMMKLYVRRSPTDDDNNVDDDFVPFTIATGGDLAGIRLSPAAASDTAKWLFANPAIDVATPDSYLRYSEHYKRWKASKFGITLPSASNNASDFSTIQKYLRMDESNSWFSECVSMATQQAKFFSDTMNFGKLDWIGTPAVGIHAHVTFNRKSQPVMDTVQWYPRFRHEADAYLTTWEPKIGQMPKVIAKHALINAHLSFHWKTDNSTEGTVIQALQDSDNVRSGPWYNRDANGDALDGAMVILEDDTRDKMKVLDRRDTYILNHYYQAEGNKV
jgi:hypothetical protein